MGSHVEASDRAPTWGGGYHAIVGWDPVLASGTPGEAQDHAQKGPRKGVILGVINDPKYGDKALYGMPHS